MTLNIGIGLLQMLYFLSSLQPTLFTTASILLNDDDDVHESGGKKIVYVLLIVSLCRINSILNSTSTRHLLILYYRYRDYNFWLNIY